MGGDGSHSSLLFYGGFGGGQGGMVSPLKWRRNLSTQQGIQPSCATNSTYNCGLGIPSLNLISSLQNMNNHTQLTEFLCDKNCRTPGPWWILVANLTPSWQPADPRTPVLIAHGRYSAKPLSLYTQAVNTPRVSFLTTRGRCWVQAPPPPTHPSQSACHLLTTYYVPV